MNEEKTVDQIHCERFIEELRELEERYNLQIDHHGDFVSLLKIRSKGKTIAILREDSDLDMEMMK